MFHHVNGLGRQPTDRNQRLLRSQVKGRNSMTVLGRIAQPLLMMAIQITYKQTGKRHGHPQPARQPLMLVNNQKSGRLVRVAIKTVHKGSVSHHKP